MPAMPPGRAGVLANNGAIYGIPWQATVIVRIDTLGVPGKDEDITTPPVPEQLMPATVEHYWKGGALNARTGVIYGFPENGLPLPWF